MPSPSPWAAPAARALVASDRTPLRAAPREGAGVHAELTQGDLLEVRGQRLDHLHVYDHRRERAGFVRAEAVRRLPPAAATPSTVHSTSSSSPFSLPSSSPSSSRAAPAGAAEAQELLSLLRFLRHAPGQEALGIAYAAAYLQAASAERIDAEPFDALGVMAERLGRRASRGRPGDATSAQVEAVAAYGVRFATLEREGRMQLCYDGEAFRRVLALKPTSAEQARAILALTRHDCVDPQLPPTARIALDAWRADLLDLPWPRGYNDLPQLTKNRLHLRRAGLWAARAHQQARQGRPAQAAAERAIAELAAVNKGEFTDDDQPEYAEAAIRVGAARWAAVGQDALARASAVGLRLVNVTGSEPGQTCVQLLAAESAPPGRRAQGPHLLAERCTFGTVWMPSLAMRPGGDALVLAVQPLEGWTELWLFRAESAVAPEAAAGAVVAEGTARTAGVAAVATRERMPWRIDVLPPAPSAPGLGYIEFAGWAPGPQPRLLVARESRIDGRFHRRFEVLALDTLDAVKQASSPQLLSAFEQFSDAQWRRRTVALR
ncbi:MAG: hypothetical protein JNJ89_18015 [Rubrivivax sp.]|nr:hypothetical protein [Rubrivivax sp.]